MAKVLVLFILAVSHTSLSQGATLSPPPSANPFMPFDESMVEVVKEAAETILENAEEAAEQLMEMGEDNLILSQDDLEDLLEAEDKDTKTVDKDDPVVDDDVVEDLFTPDGDVREAGDGDDHLEAVEERLANLGDTLEDAGEAILGDA
ncbi:uncharacterized protein LOC143296291 [Babylonia areolata]|uniref:uncharacterized protein LOC143296291 n=1 Tax=Babylonia areolata TaxID=304850 RepID=UPI003FD05DFB